MSHRYMHLTKLALMNRDEGLNPWRIWPFWAFAFIFLRKTLKTKAFSLLINYNLTHDFSPLQIDTCVVLPSAE